MYSSIINNNSTSLNSDIPFINCLKLPPNLSTVSYLFNLNIPLMIIIFCSYHDVHFLNETFAHNIFLIRKFFKLNLCQSEVTKYLLISNLNIPIRLSPNLYYYQQRRNATAMKLFDNMLPMVGFAYHLCISNLFSHFFEIKF